jgi:hypothetical protein
MEGFSQPSHRLRTPARSNQVTHKEGYVLLRVDHIADAFALPGCSGCTFCEGSIDDGVSREFRRVRGIHAKLRIAFFGFERDKKWQTNCNKQTSRNAPLVILKDESRATTATTEQIISTADFFIFFIITTTTRRPPAPPPPRSSDNNDDAPGGPGLGH